MDKSMMVTVETPKCPMCGESETVTVKAADLIRWREGVSIQVVWPDWSADERELLQTGLHSDCWDKYLGPER